MPGYASYVEPESARVHNEDIRELIKPVIGEQVEPLSMSDTEGKGPPAYAPRYVHTLCDCVIAC